MKGTVQGNWGGGELGGEESDGNVFVLVVSSRKKIDLLPAHLVYVCTQNL